MLSFKPSPNIPYKLIIPRYLTGKDPLAGLNHWKDINAVAGVFRAYFRELEEPLFLSKFCDDYIRISRKFVMSFFICEHDVTKKYGCWRGYSQQ